MTIRVLHLITRLIIGGAQENTLLTAELLDSEKWDVDVICGNQTGSEGSLIESARKRGVQLAIEPSLVREINPIRDSQALISLAQRIRREDYMIVHTHSSKAGILGRWAAWLGGAPIIVHTVHGWGHHEFQNPITKTIFILLEKLTLRITDRLIAVTPLNVQKGISDGIGNPDDYIVIRSGIELDRFGHPQVSESEVKEALGIPLNVQVVGTVTRLSPQKAPSDFIQAAAAVHDVIPNVRFVIVGDGPLRQDTEILADQLGLSNVIKFTGLRRDIPELMAIFDVFVLTSLWEGLPRVLPQAMATGLPIVATSIDGNAEAVEDGINGYLVPPNSPSEMAAKITKLLQEPEKSAAMGKKGQERAGEFGDHLMVKKIENLYLELMGKKNLI